MTAQFEAVLAVYYGRGASCTRTELLWDLRDRNRTQLNHAAFVVANAGKYDERGMPTTRMTERLAAQRELLKLIAPEIEAMEAEADRTHFDEWSSAEVVSVAFQHA